MGAAGQQCARSRGENARGEVGSVDVIAAKPLGVDAPRQANWFLLNGLLPSPSASRSRQTVSIPWQDIFAHSWEMDSEVPDPVLSLAAAPLRGIACLTSRW